MTLGPDGQRRRIGLDVSSLGPWLALAFALSPALVELAAHVFRTPWARAQLLFVPLFALAMACERRPQPALRRTRLGLGLIGLALGFIAFSVAGGLASVGRLAIPAAVLGLSAYRGRRWPGAALLAVWLVPLPSIVIAGGSPGLEQVWGEARRLTPSAVRRRHRLGNPAAGCERHSVPRSL